MVNTLNKPHTPLPIPPKTQCLTSTLAAYQYKPSFHNFLSSELIFYQKYITLLIFLIVYMSGDPQKHDIEHKLLTPSVKAKLQESLCCGDHGTKISDHMIPIVSHFMVQNCGYYVDTKLHRRTS